MIPFAGKFLNVTNTPMISMQFLRIRFFQEFWLFPANWAVIPTAGRFWNRLSISCTTSTAHFPLWLKNPALSKGNYTAIQISYIPKTRRSSTTTVRIITLKLSRMTISESMERAKKTDQTPSSRWDCLWMLTGFPSLLTCSRGTRMNSQP